MYKYILENILSTLLSKQAWVRRTGNCALHCSCAALFFSAWRCPSHSNNEHVPISPPVLMLGLCFYPSVCEIVSHCRFNLSFLNVLKCQLDIYTFSLEKCLFKSFAPTFNWVVLLLNYGNFLYVLNILLIKYMI